MSSFDNPFTSAFAEDEEGEEEATSTNATTLETSAPPAQEAQMEDGAAQPVVMPLPSPAAVEAPTSLEPAPAATIALDDAPQGPTFAVVEEEEEEEENAPGEGPAGEENGEDDDYAALLLRVAELEASEKMSGLHETTMRMTKKEERTLMDYIEAQKNLLQKESALRRNSGGGCGGGDLRSGRRKRERSDATTPGIASIACSGAVDTFLENSQWDLVSQHANAHFLFIRETEERLQKVCSATASSSNQPEEPGEGAQEGCVGASTSLEVGSPLESVMRSVQDMYAELRSVSLADASTESAAKKFLQESKQQVSLGTQLLRMAGSIEGVQQREVFRKLCTLLLSTASETEKLLLCRQQLRGQLEVLARRTRPLVASVQELTAAAVQREMEQTVRCIESSYVEQQLLGTNKQLLKQLADLEAVTGMVALAQSKGISPQELMTQVKHVATEAELEDLKKQLEEKEKLYDKLVMEVLFLRKCGLAHDPLGVMQTALGPIPALETSHALGYSCQQLIEENCELLSKLVLRLTGAAPSTPTSAPVNEEDEENTKDSNRNSKEGETNGENRESGRPAQNANAPLSAQLLSMQEAIASRQNTLNTLLSQNARLWQSLEHTAIVARYVYSSDATELVREFFRRSGVATDGLAELLDESFQSRASDQSVDGASAPPAARLSLLDIQQQAIDAYQRCVQELHEAAQTAVDRVGELYTRPRSRLQHEIAFWVKLLNCLDLQEAQKLCPGAPFPTDSFQNIPLHRLTRHRPVDGDVAGVNADDDEDDGASSLFHFLTVPRTNQSLLAPFKQQTEEMRGELKALRESIEKKCDTAQAKIDWYAQYTVSEVEQKLEDAKEQRALLQQQSKEAEAHTREMAHNTQKAQELQERLAKLRLRRGGVHAELLRKQQAVLAAILRKEEELRESAVSEANAAWEELVHAHLQEVATAAKREEEKERAAVKEEPPLQSQPDADAPAAAVKVETEDTAATTTTSNIDGTEMPAAAPPVAEEDCVTEPPFLTNVPVLKEEPVADAVKQEAEEEAEIAIKQEASPGEASEAVNREASPFATIKEEPQWTPEHQQRRADVAQEAHAFPQTNDQTHTETAPDVPLLHEEELPLPEASEEAAPLPVEAREEQPVDSNPAFDEPILGLHASLTNTTAATPAAVVDEEQGASERASREDRLLERTSPLDEEDLLAAPAVNEEEDAARASSSAMAPEVAVEGSAPAEGEEEMENMQPVLQEPPGEAAKGESALAGDESNDNNVESPLLPLPVSAPRVDEKDPAAEGHQVEVPLSEEANGEYYNPFYNDESFP